MIDTAVRVGSLTLANPVMTASGTAGHGTELAAYGDLSALGAVTVKSVAAYPWAGNPAPRIHPTSQGMLNAVGLQGPGVQAWVDDDLPALVRCGAAAVVSIWGRSVDDYARAAALLAGTAVIAIEINLSCPNLEGRSGIFAHDADLSASVVRAVRDALGSGDGARPVWAKLSPNTDRIVDVAGAVADAGADAVTLINTVLGMAFDPETHGYALGNGGGGLSGRAIHPVAVRAVHDVHDALPDLPIVGVGGVASGWDAVELMLAGASAIQVGTATFADPHAPWKVLAGLVEWATERGARTVRELTGARR